jgi:hypothetical protein
VSRRLGERVEEEVVKMRWNLVVGALIALVASLLAVLPFGGTAHAQYPPPTGNVTVIAENMTPAVGTTVPVAATVRDQYGSVVAGVACTFVIVSQPGTSATVAPGPVSTDVNGVANTTLSTGTTAGTITVEAICGELTSQVSVVVGEPVAVGLPPTGTGDADMPAGVVWTLAMVAATALGIGGMLVVATVRRRSRAVRR